MPILYVENVPGDSHGNITRDQIIDALGDAAADYEIVLADADSPDFDALHRAQYFAATRFDTGRMREHARAVRIVHCLNAGVERFAPFDWLTPETILTNSSGVHADMVGEYGVMALLMLNHHVPEYAGFQREHRWQRLPTRSIRGKRVLVIGTGGLGAAIASHARMLGVELIGVSRSGAPHPAFDRVEPTASLDALLPEADFVILACPLTAETHHLVDRARLSRFKRGASLINVGRGALVDADALDQALRDSLLAGAVLDVHEVEPLPSDRAEWQMQRTIITPHVSCDTDDDYVGRGLAILADNLARAKRGETLRNIVDRSLGY